VVDILGGYGVLGNSSTYRELQAAGLRLAHVVFPEW
jgi:hypothetical protein